MSTPKIDPLVQVETTCGTLLYELQIIWDEVGETDTDWDKMLLELERECLEPSLLPYARQWGKGQFILGRKFEELHRQLHELQKEKSDRLKQVQDYLNTLNSLYSVMGMDFKLTVNKIHPSLSDPNGFKSISNNTIEQLATLIKILREVELQRMQRLQDLATTMLDLWNLMDTPIEEQQEFQNVTCNVAASEHEITEPDTPSVDFINYVEAEVSRLEQLKSSKMKELVLKKRLELGEICGKTHLVPDSQCAKKMLLKLLRFVDAATILEQIEVQIAKVKEEAFSRKEILENVEKWLMECDEECWLEEYNWVRAEKTRALVNKLPGMVEALASKTMAWEKEREIVFLYDGIRLLSMLEEYIILGQEKEQERRRLRDQKKPQGQLIAEQEALYGSKPSPSKPQSVKKGPRYATGGASNRRVSLGGATIPSHKPDSLHSAKATPKTTKKNDRMFQNDHLNHRQDDAIPAFSAVTRGLDIADTPVRKHSSTPTVINANEPESPLLVRKSFSPITSAVLKTNMTNMLEVEDNGDTSYKMLHLNNDLSYTTPLRTIALVDEENGTPKVMPMPCTPSTV
ncbi:65-kDa microtubule-associated protein 3 [Hibiscus syriacus]|uniref:65-kDa microtubule-associated protein 3 n=1 Tax=Hibiscus syriacus TaxID=106335 RepID=A0A6A2YQB0_HIBSY|nr:65-kDa microtubule-associated protein 3 [Hibiscus syriacus]